MKLLSLSGLALVLWLTATAAVGQTTPTIDLAEALRRTLAENRQLQDYPFQLAGAEALQLQAGLRPVPTLSLEVENALGSGAFHAFDASETTLALSQLIELGDKREYRLQAARAYRDELAAEYELARLDVLAETSRRYYQLLRIQARQALNQRRVQMDREALAAIRTRASAGAATRAEQSKLDLRLAHSLSRSEALANQHSLAAARLAAMWLGEVNFSEARGSLGQLPELADIEPLLQRIDEAPALQQSIALQRVADSRLALAQAQGSADLTLSLGVRHLEASGDQALVFGARMPLVFENPNRGRIAAARAERERSSADIALSRQQLLLELRHQYQLLRNHQARLAQLQGELLPRARTLLKATTDTYRQGRASVLQWADAAAERFGLEQEIIERRYASHLQLLELERITGRSLLQQESGEES